MIVDCDCCVVRGDACRDCVISVLLEAPPGAQHLQLDAPERRAFATLAEHGLVPGLRLVAAEPRRACRTDYGKSQICDIG